MRRSSLWAALLAALFLVIIPLAAGASHSYESIRYTIDTSPQQTSFDCRLQVLALDPNLSSVRITIPYPRSDLSQGPTLVVGKSVVQPESHEGEDSILLVIPLPEMKVGELLELRLKFSVEGGCEIRGGAIVKVQTLGLDANSTEQSIQLQMPKGFVVSKVETPFGSAKGKGSAGLYIGPDPCEVSIYVRRKNPFDYLYFNVGLAVAIIAAASYPIARSYLRRPRGGEGENRKHISE